MSKNNFIGCEALFDEARVILYSAPFDSTTSFRPGTRFAGQAIRNDSNGLEIYSPYQDKELETDKVCDFGELELAIGDSEKVLAEIYKCAKMIVSSDKLPFMVGGEHLVTYGAVRAVAEKYPDLHIIHFDAHTDLREDYLGVKLSHASVIKRCWDILGDGRIHQFGIRSGEREEFLWAKSGHTDFHPFTLDGLDETLEKIGDAPVYFTLDLDVLDPSVFPGTGTPEPGGMDFLSVMRSATKVCQKANIVGCDVNELCPHYDASGASTAVACKIIREMLISLT